MGKLEFSDEVALGELTKLNWGYVAGIFKP